MAKTVRCPKCGSIMYRDNEKNIIECLNCGPIGYDYEKADKKSDDEVNYIG
jgi:DNA-directed RNA polymerase subunit M/transcription elongation factor TFIIS